MEAPFVDWLLARLPRDPRLEVPPGDDAAVLRPPAGRRTVITVDLLTEGVDFLLGGDTTAARVGHKALAVNLSDLAAMGARPEAAVVAVALPREGAAALGKGIHAGLAPLAARFGMTIAGGDTNTWDGPLVISVTAIGSVPPIARVGGRRRRLTASHWSGPESAPEAEIAPGRARPHSAVKASSAAQARSGCVVSRISRGMMRAPAPRPAMKVARTRAIARVAPPTWRARS